MTFSQIKENLENIETIEEFTFQNGFKIVTIKHLKDEGTNTISVISSSGNATSKGIEPEIQSETKGGDLFDFLTISFFDANSLTSAEHRLLLKQRKN